MTSVPKGNNIPVLFSIGDQDRIDEWYKRLNDGKFGVMQFTAIPVAVPPTLTIFVQNEVIDLNLLDIPDGIEVTAGYCPKVFHKWNLDRKEEQQQDNSNESANAGKSTNDATKQATDQIDKFLERRNRNRKVEEVKN